MVVKYGLGPNDVWFLEATPKSGVSIRSWTEIKDYVGTKVTAAIRHLDW